VIQMPCPRCAKLFQLADVLRGQIINCTDCGTAMRVEAPADDDEPLLLVDDEPEEGIQEEPPDEPALRIGVDPKRLSVKRLRKKKKKRRSPSESFLVEQWYYVTGSLGVFSFVLLGLVAFWLFLLLLTPLVPQVAMGMITLGGILYTVGWWWIVFIAYRDDGIAGTLCLMTMFYVFVYAYMNLEATWHPAGLMLLGMLMTVTGYAAGFHFGVIRF
jgi:hypothetical protein